VPASSATAPFVIELEAGSYDVGATTILLPAHVTLRGAGANSSFVRGNGNKVLETAGNTTVSDLTIENSTTLSGAEVMQLGATSADADIFVYDVRIVATSGSDAQTDGIDARGSGVVISNAWISARDGAIKTGSGATIEVTGSLLRGEQSALITLNTGNAIDIIGSRLESTGLFGDLLRIQTTGHVVRVSNSTLSAAAQAISVAGSGNNVTVVQSHVEAGAAFSLAAGNTLTCAGLSTPAGAVVGCV
jgi:hypothetical protein